MDPYVSDKQTDRQRGGVREIYISLERKRVYTFQHTRRRNFHILILFLVAVALSRATDTKSDIRD